MNSFPLTQRHTQPLNIFLFSFLHFDIISSCFFFFSCSSSCCNTCVTCESIQVRDVGRVLRFFVPCSENQCLLAPPISAVDYDDEKGLLLPTPTCIHMWKTKLNKHHTFSTYLKKTRLPETSRQAMYHDMKRQDMAGKAS